MRKWNIIFLSILKNSTANIKGMEYKYCNSINHALSLSDVS